MNDKNQILSLLVIIRGLQERLLTRQMNEILILDKISDSLKELTALLTIAEKGTTTTTVDVVKVYGKDDEGETTAVDNKQTRLNL